MAVVAEYCENILVSRTNVEVHRTEFVARFEQTLVGFMNDAADMARSVFQRRFRGEVPLLQDARAEIDALVRTMVARRFPSHGFCSALSGGDILAREFVWVLDPVGGESSFTMGMPLFGFVLGLLNKGRPFLGLVDQPHTRERWVGRSGVWARHNGREISVAPPCLLSTSRVCTGELSAFDNGDMDVFLALSRSAGMVRHACDCYAYGLLAMGSVDAVVDRGLDVLDVAGVIPIVTGAGGCVVDWHLNPISMLDSANWDGHLIATSSVDLAEEYVDLVRITREG